MQLHFLLCDNTICCLLAVVVCSAYRDGCGCVQSVEGFVLCVAGIKQNILHTLLSYNPLWLRIGLEVSGRRSAMAWSPSAQQWQHRRRLAFL